MKDNRYIWATAIGGVLIGTVISRHLTNKEERARAALLRQALALAERAPVRVIGAHLTADDQWQIVALTDAGAAFGWFGKMTHGGYHPDPGSFTVWVDKGERDWRQTASAHASYGSGR